GCDGQAGLAQAGQRTLMNLAPDFHANHQEEHRHQRVVDPEVQRLGEADVANAEGNRRMPERAIMRCKGRVSPEQGDGGGDQQHDAAGSLDMGETFEGSQSALGKELRARQILPRNRAMHGQFPRTGGPTYAKNLSSRCIAATPWRRSITTAPGLTNPSVAAVRPKSNAWLASACSRTDRALHGVRQLSEPGQVVLQQHFDRHPRGIGADIDGPEQIAVAGKYGRGYRAQPQVQDRKSTRL